MINYKHLHYFWVVAKQGSIARASEQLHITPQTISGQLSLLEQQLGAKLFNKAGRGLTLTDTGRMVLSYADEIFSLGSELEQVVHKAPGDRPLEFRVGVVDVVPKSIAYRLLAPALALPDPVKMVCKESTLELLLGELAVHKIDMVIADIPIPTGLSVRGYNHSLGSSGISFLAVPAMAKPLTKDFPASLDGAPLLIPSAVNRVQSRLFNWFDSLRIYPHIIGEFDDSALMKAFGHAGAGVFLVPTAIEHEVIKQYGVKAIGRTDEVTEHFYAITVDRRISHPAIAAVTDTAREWLV